MYGSEPLHIDRLKAEAERLQRRFEKADNMAEFARISEEASRRIALLAPIADLLQLYMIISEIAHREYEAIKRKELLAAKEQVPS
jgi:hypothetical protein